MKDQTALLPMVTDIVSAHLSHNSVSSAELPDVIRKTYEALAGVSVRAANGEAGSAPANQNHRASNLAPATERPIISVKKSIQPNYLVCLEDGKHFKTLKRHLQSSYGLTPESYRARWNLPATYPMIAPNYSKVRSKIAKATGLGTGEMRTVPTRKARSKVRAKTRTKAQRKPNKQAQSKQNTHNEAPAAEQAAA